MAKFVLVGGREFIRDDGGIDAYLAKLAGDRIGLIAAASPVPRAVYMLMSKTYRRFGTKVVLVKRAEQLNGLKAVYLCGGHPDKLLKALKNTDLGSKLRELIKSGLVIAGSSAGAMVLFSKMMAHGSRMKGGTELTDGLGLLSGPIIVPHWNTADANWKNAFVKAHEVEGILGIDENTAFIWEDGQEKTIGLGQIHKFGPTDIK